METTISAGVFLMFFGQFQNSIDAKNRVIIPAKYRDELRNTCIITKGLDDCLEIYTAAAWEREQQKLETLPGSSSEARAYKRLRYANAVDCDMDKQGRIVLPPFLKEAARIEKDLVTIGMRDHLEIWSREVYEQSEVGGLMKAEDFADFSYEI